MSPPEVKNRIVSFKALRRKGRSSHPKTPFHYSVHTPGYCRLLLALARHVRLSAELVVSRAERQPHGGAEQAQRLVQTAEVLVPPPDGPAERPVLALDDVPEGGGR